MDCFAVKRFISQTCCSCRTGDSTASDEVQITKISKISASGSVQSFLTSANGNHHTEKKEIPSNGTNNPAYQTEVREPKAAAQTAQQRQDKVVNEQPIRLKPTGLVYERQISDLSTISGFSPPAEMELSEMVLEGLEKSLSNDEAIKELEKSFHGRDYGTEESSIGREATTAEPGAKNDTTAGESDQIEDTSHIMTVETGDLDWRNLPTQDFSGDDDFVLVSSGEEDDVNEPDENRAKLENSEQEINDNTKHTDKLEANSARAETISNSGLKCGNVPLVIDVGSYEIKAGHSGEFAPACRFRTVVGTWRSRLAEAYREQDGDLLFGAEALSKNKALDLKYPIQDGGVIVDWEDFESVLDHTLSHFEGVDVKDHPLLLTEPTMVPMKQRERQLEVVMETFHCPMTQFRSQASLSALTAGNDVALMVNSGHGCTEIVPIYYGNAIRHAVQRVNVGGRHITEYLGRLLLKDRGIDFSSVADLVELDRMKKKYAEIRSDDVFPTEAWSKMIQHELPDGGIVELGAEMHKCTQPLFNPRLIGDSGGSGLVDAIKQAVRSLDPEIRPIMQSSVLLSGGNCCLTGFRRQVKEKLCGRERKKKPKNGKKSWRVALCHDVKNCAWIGGSLYSQSEAFRDTCVTNDAYFEYGSAIIHNACF